MAKDGASADADARRLERLKREAEVEMRRRLEDSRPSKRAKLPGDPARAGGVPFVPVDRFRYAVVGELEAGAKGFIVTCNFRKEKSATREASQLLRRYMPAHLFPPLPQPEAAPAGRAEPQGSQGQAEAQCAAGAAVEAGEGAGAGALQAGAGGRKAAPAAAKAGEEVEVDVDSGDSSDEDSEEGQGADGGEAAAGAGGTAADHHPEPSALGLAKVGCRGVVVMRLSSRAAAEVEPVRLLEALLTDLEGVREAQAVAKQQKLQKKEQKQKQKQKQQGKGKEEEGAGQEPEAKKLVQEEEEQAQEERGAAALPLQQPKHCQRLVPLDATCALTPAGLTRAVMDAAAAYRRRLAAPSSGPAAEGPQAAEELRSFTYAVLYHSRDTTETAAAAAAAAAVPVPGASGPVADAAATDAASGGAGKTGGEGSESELTDRGRIIEIVAAAMRTAFGEAASVNLKKPDVAVVVEAMPVAGRRFAGVSLLGSHLMLAKGKLQVKPLTNNPPPQPKAAGQGKGKGTANDH